MIYTITFNPALDYTVQVEKFEIGKINRTKSENILAGGKGLNVSIILKRLGIENTALSFIAGFTGKELERKIRQYNIETEFIETNRGYTRINVKISSLEKNSLIQESETALNGNGPEITENDIEKLLQKIQNINSNDIVILSGNIPKCINENIFFWNVKREKSTIVYINTGIKDFKRLCRIARECKCKIQIKEKKGLPFILNRYRKRKIFAFFVILIAILLIVTSKFVWNIRVEGNNKINQSEIVSMLEQKGLKVGTLKSRVNSQEIINEIRLERADIAWIGISIEGTNAIVKIVEAEAKPEIINEEDYCNIIATKDAQIVKISAQNGIPVVKQDDVVTKGDILIAGWIDGKYTGTRYVHAEGEVKAKVWYTEKEKVALNQVIEEKTGNTEEKYKIKINNFTINLFKTLPKFEKYDTIETCNSVKIFSNFYLPIELVKITNSEIVEKQITYGTEEAKQLSVQKACKKIEEKLQDNPEVLQKYVNTNVNNDYVEAEVTYEVLENIGTKEKIVF